MCMAVRYGDGVFGTLSELVSAGLISAEHVPSDPELAQSGVNVLDVCFCCIDVEDILHSAGVRFTLDPDWGDVLVTSATTAAGQPA